jgi:uncharacterized protein with HEPN domain
LEQIGVNVKRLSDEITKKHDELSWSGMAGMRDIISHKYHRANYPKLRTTITEDIPILKEKCEQILYEFENP